MTLYVKVKVTEISMTVESIMKIVEYVATVTVAVH